MSREKVILNEQGSVRDTLLVLRSQYNYHVDQSDLLTRFRTDFTSSVWNFCRGVTDVFPGEISLAARNKKKQEEHGLISQIAARNLSQASNDKKLYQNYT